MPKLLPRWAYQLVALLALFLVYGLAADLALRDWIPFDAIASVVGRVFAFLLTLLCATFAWVLVVLPLRLISDAPAIVPSSREEMRAQWEKGLREARDESTPEARRRRHFRIAAAATALELAALAALAANVELMPDSLFLFPVVLAVACALLAPYHFVRGLLTR